MSLSTLGLNSDVESSKKNFYTSKHREEKNFRREQFMTELDTSWHLKVLKESYNESWERVS